MVIVHLWCSESSRVDSTAVETTSLSSTPSSGVGTKFTNVCMTARHSESLRSNSLRLCVERRWYRFQQQDHLRHTLRRRSIWHSTTPSRLWWWPLISTVNRWKCSAEETPITHQGSVIQATERIFSLMISYGSRPNCALSAYQSGPNGKSPS